MPKTVTFEGTTHQFPDDATDDEVSAALNSAHPSTVDMSEKNYGTTKPEGEGFLAHASKTIRDLPDAFTSGRIVSAPLKSMADSMGEYVASPSLHNSIRAIPGVGMMEDAISAPYRTGASGDTAGAWGDAVDLAGQAALGLHGRVPEPLQAVRGTPAETAAPLIPQSMIDATHMLPIKGAPIRMGMRLINGGARLVGGGEAPGRVYDMSLKPDFGSGVSVDRTPRWNGVQNAQGPRIVDPGSRIGQNEFAQPLDPAEASLPSGRVPGGIHNATETLQRPERPPALWQQFGAGPVASESTDFTPIQGDLPSGRYPISSRFPEAPAPPRTARVPGWMDRGVSVSQDEPVRFSSIRGALPSGRSPGAFEVPHQAEILPTPISGASDMSDILRQSIDAIKARKNGSAPPPDETSALPMKVRRRK